MAAIVGWGWWRGATAERETRKELAELRQRRQRLERVNHSLDTELTAMKRELEAHVRAARETLDVVGRDEVLVILPPTPAATVAK
jgi:cell division protein FtsB